VQIARRGKASGLADSAHILAQRVHREIKSFSSLPIELKRFGRIVTRLQHGGEQEVCARPSGLGIGYGLINEFVDKLRALGGFFDSAHDARSEKIRKLSVACIGGAKVESDLLLVEPEPKHNPEKVVFNGLPGAGRRSRVGEGAGGYPH